MAVWGLGSIFKVSPPREVTRDFIDNGCACIGWKENQAPVLYEVFKTIQVGDYIYLKSYSIKYKRLTIKAVGKVIDNRIQERFPKKDLSFGMLVDWTIDFKKTTIDFQDNPKFLKYYVYPNTLYQEYNPKIIELIKEAVNNTNSPE